MSKFYNVKFKDHYDCLLCESDEKLKIANNVTVVVQTERGEQFGKVISQIENILDNDISNKILRISTKNDYNKYVSNLKEAEDALEFCKKKVEELNLNMKVLDADYTLDKKQLLFNFVSDERVDFRNLAKVIASKYKTRIELRQIGARDRAKQVSGIGICGKTLCCATFLSHIDSISINMAKNQNIALNPNKINGNCGRLLCCLTYEDDVYTDLKKDLPLVGQEINTEYGKGKVINVDILKRKYKVLINNEVKEIELNKNESSKE